MVSTILPRPTSDVVFLPKSEQCYFPNPDSMLLLGPFQNFIYHDQLRAFLRMSSRFAVTYFVEPES